MITLMIMAPMIRADDVEGGSTLHLKGKGLTPHIMFCLDKCIRSKYTRSVFDKYCATL